MTRKYPEGFYVYLHVRKSDGLVFYVGKGFGPRAWITHRPDWWKRVRNKHGCRVEIFKSGMIEVCALTLEKVMIAKYRALGHPLVNITDGGEGLSGRISENSTTVVCSNGMEFPSYSHAARWVAVTYKIRAMHTGIIACCSGAAMSSYGFTWWKKGDNPKEYINPSVRVQKKIHCSNGLVFESGITAVDWLKKNGFESAESGSISKACNGQRHTSFGFSWWFDGDAPKIYIDKITRSAESKYKAVNCSNGMSFDSAVNAVLWLKENGHPKASTGCISDACSGNKITAYGFSWWFDGSPEKEFVPHTRSVVCSNGMVFSSVKEATAWLTENGHPKASWSAISAVCQGRRNNAYGYSWRYNIA